jgi:hypothetical protein
MTTRSDAEDNMTPLPEDGAPLEPWMLELANEAVDDLDAELEVPRAMMWARIDRERRGAAVAAPLSAPVSRLTPRLRQITAIAAVLVGGVAIGRYVVPSDTPVLVASGDSAKTASHDPTNDVAYASDPAHVAMQEHLVRTVALLAAVQTPNARNTQPELVQWAGDLLTTTRLLIDQPQLRDERTRRLLQDLELVLVQILQARSSAPETQRAPQETMRETNLLTRVRAVVTASNAHEALTYGGNE